MKPAEVFVSKLHTDTSKEDIMKYLTSQFKNVSNVECETLKTKLDIHNSFRVTLHDLPFMSRWIWIIGQEFLLRDSTHLRRQLRLA